MRVAIVGSRDYQNLDQVRRYVQGLAERHPDAVVISGGARGVDSAAVAEARRLGLEFVEIRPDWRRGGRGAGLARNQEIVDQAEHVVAFWDGTSRGTADTIKKARAVRKLLAVFRADSPV